MRAKGGEWMGHGGGRRVEEGRASTPRFHLRRNNSDDSSKRCQSESECDKNSGVISEYRESATWIPARFCKGAPL